MLLPTQGTLRGLFSSDPAHGESDNRDRIPGTKTPLENGEFTVVVRTGCGRFRFAISDRDRAQSDPPKAQVMENLAMYQQLLRLTLISAARRFAALSIELRADDEEPWRPHLKTASRALKNLDQVDTRTFSTESTRSGR